jgi:hypothetical protein
MLILFDQGTPVPLRPHLTGHTIITASQNRWDKLKNGELLAAAEDAGFELLITTDKNIRYQQNLVGRKIAIIVLGQQQWPIVRGHIEKVIAAVASIQAGGFVEVEIPYTE